MPHKRVNAGALLLGAIVLLGITAVYALQLRNRDLRDFGTFWASGNAVRQGLPPYAVYPLTWRVHVWSTGQVVLDPNLSPPALLPLFGWMARWNPNREIIAWTYASYCAFLAAALLVAFGAGFKVQRRQLLWMLLAPSILHTLWLGQDYAYLALLSAGIWLCFRKHQLAAAGVLLGVLCAAKPNLLLWPLLLWLAGHRRTAAVGVLTFAGSSAAPAFLYGPHIYIEWRNALALTNHSIFPTDVSLVGYATRLGSRTAGFALAVCVAIAIGVWAYRRRPELDATSGVAICASILCSPLAWFHYTILLMPWMVRRRWNLADSATALLMLLPLDTTIQTIGASGWPAVYGGFPYLLAVVGALAVFMMRGADVIASKSPLWDAPSIQYSLRETRFRRTSAALHADRLDAAPRLDESS